MTDQFISGLIKMAGDAVAKISDLPLDMLFQKVNDIFEEISTGLPKKEFTLKDLTEIYSDPLDTVMKKAQTEGYIPAGGMFTVRYIDDAHYGISYDIYMKDAEGKWSKRSGESPALTAVCLKDEVMAELKQKGKVVYEIDPPTSDVRKEGE